MCRSMLMHHNGPCAHRLRAVFWGQVCSLNDTPETQIASNTATFNCYPIELGLRPGHLQPAVRVPSQQFTKKGQFLALYSWLCILVPFICACPYEKVSGSEEQQRHQCFKGFAYDGFCPLLSEIPGFCPQGFCVKACGAVVSKKGFLLKR